MLHTLHLVRHGEVHNPDHVVYADIPGFGLSATGHRQAASTASNLGRSGADTVITSPLQRAAETAAPIAAATGCSVTTDDRLTEWGLGRRWAGVGWDDLPQVFPGELEAYLNDPIGVDFGPETIAAVAHRMAAVITDITPLGAVAIVVSHQDPIQALRLHLLGRSLATLHDEKPMHAEVITFNRDASGWSQSDRWAPAEGSASFPPVVDTDQS